MVRETGRKACKRKARRGSPIMKRRASCEDQRCRVVGQNGDIAQLGERVLCKHEVVGSIPSVSTKPLVCCSQTHLSLARPRTFGPAGDAGVSTKRAMRLASGWLVGAWAVCSAITHGLSGFELFPLSSLLEKQSLPGPSGSGLFLTSLKRRFFRLRGCSSDVAKAMVPHLTARIVERASRNWS